MLLSSFFLCLYWTAITYPYNFSALLYYGEREVKWHFMGYILVVWLKFWGRDNTNVNNMTFKSTASMNSLVKIVTYGSTSKYSFPWLKALHNEGNNIVSFEYGIKYLLNSFWQICSCSAFVAVDHKGLGKTLNYRFHWERAPW